MEKKLKPRILVVDDDQDICETLEEILEIEGYRIVTATSGLRALREIQTQVFDAILLDIRMPGMNGLEALERFKEIAPQTPIIMMTAYSSSDAWVRNAIEANADGVLRKPFDLDLLLFRLEAIADQRPQVLVFTTRDSSWVSIEQAFKSWDCRVFRKQKKQATLDALYSQSFDLFLLDGNLHITSLLETIKALIKVRPSARIAVLAPSGCSNELEAQVLEAGAFACVKNVSKALLSMDRRDHPTISVIRNF